MPFFVKAIVFFQLFEEELLLTELRIPILAVCGVKVGNINSFNVISTKTQTIFWQHETIKTLTVIKSRITDKKLNNKNI